MEKLKFNPSNKKYYSEEFIKGFECGVERQFNADVEEKTDIEKIKSEIEEYMIISFFDDEDMQSIRRIFDKYIKERKEANEQKL